MIFISFELEGFCCMPISGVVSGCFSINLCSNDLFIIDDVHVQTNPK
jgi:hypothetical protein